MSLVKKIVTAFFSIFTRKKSAVSFLPHDKILILSPDGTWSIKDSKVKPQNTNSFYGFPATNYHFDAYEESILLGPPDEFPQKRELRDKLDRCLELGVISSCSHKTTRSGVYTLDIQLPYESESSTNWNQYKMFVKAMEEKYQFETLREEKITSKISSEKYYAVTFQFDPRKAFLNKK